MIATTGFSEQTIEVWSQPYCRAAAKLIDNFWMLPHRKPTPELHQERIRIRLARRGIVASRMKWAA